jgi:hypothetical protein
MSVTDSSLTLTSSGTAGVVALIAPAQMIHGAVSEEEGSSMEKIGSPHDK